MCTVGSYAHPHRSTADTYTQASTDIHNGSTSCSNSHMLEMGRGLQGLAP